jgi:hypothetical protein
VVWDLCSASRKVSGAKGVVAAVVKDQEFLPAPKLPTRSRTTSTLVPRTPKGETCEEERAKTEGTDLPDLAREGRSRRRKACTHRRTATRTARSPGHHIRGHRLTSRGRCLAARSLHGKRRGEEPPPRKEGRRHQTPITPPAAPEPGPWPRRRPTTPPELQRPGAEIRQPGTAWGPGAQIPAAPFTGVVALGRRRLWGRRGEGETEGTSGDGGLGFASSVAWGEMRGG